MPSRAMPPGLGARTCSRNLTTLLTLQGPATRSRAIFDRAAQVRHAASAPPPISSGASNRKTDQLSSTCERSLWTAACLGCYRLFFPDFFAAAQRLRIASAMRFRPAADIVRRFGTMMLFLLPAGRPRRLPWPSVPSRAWIAASSRLRSCLSCWTISSRFMAES